MMMKKQYFSCLLWMFLFWRFCKTKASMDICDEVQPGIYCGCKISYRETTITCFISNFTLIDHNEVWNSLATVDNLVSLKLLSRLEARLTYIPTEYVERMSNLRDLSIKQGVLGELKSYTISRLKNLKDLMLDGNEITSLQNHAISSLPKLQKLTLSENLLEEVLADSLTGLDELEQLHLDRNNISRIESCAFCDLQNLRELELWGNQITDITEYTFRGLRYLKRLDLYKNMIRILNDKVFHTMPKLQEIDLKDNFINHIAPRAFFGLERLQVLKLNKNHLKVLPDEVFKSLPNLRSLELHHNLFETIQSKVFENMDNVKDEHFQLALKENPFKCDCQLQWVKTYLKVNRSHQFTRELQDMKCNVGKKMEADSSIMNVSDYLTQYNCKKSNLKPRIVTTPTSTTKATAQVPIELFSGKNKALATDDSVYVSDDDDDDDNETHQDAESVDDSSCIQISSGFVIIFAFLLAKRMEYLIIN